MQFLMELLDSTEEICKQLQLVEVIFFIKFIECIDDSGNKFLISICEKTLLGGLAVI